MFAMKTMKNAVNERDPAGHVEIENALNCVHRLLVRRDEKRGIAREDHQRGSDDECNAITRPFMSLDSFIPRPDNRTAATKPSETRYQIPRGMRPRCGRAPADRSASARGGFHGRNQQRRENRQQQKRQQQFAHARVRGNRRKNRAGNHQTERAQQRARKSDGPTTATNDTL